MKLSVSMGTGSAIIQKKRTKNQADSAENVVWLKKYEGFLSLGIFVITECFLFRFWIISHFLSFLKIFFR